MFKKYLFLLVSLCLLVSTSVVYASGELKAIPVMGYSSSTGVALGAVGFINETATASSRIRLNTFRVSGTFTSKGQSQFVAKQKIYGKQGFVSGVLKYRNYPTDFYGLGAFSDEESEESYDEVTTGLDLSGFRQLRPELFGGIKLRVENVNVSGFDSDGQLKTGVIRGANDAFHVGLGLVLQGDSRDSDVYPTSGHFVETQAMTYDPVWGSDIRFSTYKFDARRYDSVGDDVIAMQFFVNTATGDTPFYYLSKLGGKNIMRGYSSGRYRDNTLVASQIEYRVKDMFTVANKPIGMVFFLGLGQVFDQPSKFSARDLIPSGGFGFRIPVTKEGNNLRLDFGYGRDSRSVSVTINEAF